MGRPAMMSLDELREKIGTKVEKEDTSPPKEKPMEGLKITSTAWEIEEEGRSLVPPNGAITVVKELEIDNRNEVFEDGKGIKATLKEVDTKPSTAIHTRVMMVWCDKELKNIPAIRCISCMHRSNLSVLKFEIECKYLSK